MPDINAMPADGSARHPRGAVKLNGKTVIACEALEVDNNRFRAADTFHATFAVGALPSGYGPAWFGSQASIDLEMFLTADWQGDGAYLPTSADLLILGQVDDIEFDPIAGTVSLSGRDWTAKLIDTKTSENFTAKKASEVATIFAGRHGLTPVVTATKAQIGTYYSQNKTRLTQERSEWDVLCELARFEDFDVYVKGRELHFAPKPNDTGERYAIAWSAADGIAQANVTAMRFDRSLTIAKGVTVTVRSWHMPSGKAFEASWPKNPKPTKPGQSGAAEPLQYHYTVAGLTQDQATQRAKALYDEINRHMVTISADLPGDDLLDCSMVVQVRGTGTAWDQDYFPDSVKRSLSMDEGYRMTVTAKNVSDTIEATD